MKQPSRAEFVALVAVLFATVAFSIDSMLPSLPQIAAELTPDAVNRAQLVLSAFIVGMGAGTFVTGPLSDTFGRKAVMTGGFVLYIIGALVASVATSMEMLLAARLVQGIGAAGPRVAAQAMIRDLYAGRAMAQLMSFVMMVFILIPALAPSLGAVISGIAGWRGVFVAFVIFGVINTLWLNLRQPETLPKEERRSLRPAALMGALREVLGNRLVVIYIAVLTVSFGMLFALISSIQQIYADGYGVTDRFPLWFMASGLLSGSASILNASLVMRLGMRRLAIAAFAVQTAISAVLLVLALSGIMGHVPPFWVFFLWSVTLFAMAGLTFGNLNALALEPLGHIAGMGASVIGAVSTVLSVLIAVPIGLAFNGTPVPLMVGALVCSGVALLLMRHARHLDPTPKKAPPGGPAPVE